jgi:hypothetical protein
MNIATALLQAIKERGLDSLFQVEEGAAKQPKATIISTLKGQTEDPAQPAHPTPEDQLRLVIIYYLSVADHATPKEDLAELTGLLREAGADVAALDYVKKVREVTRMTMMATQPAVAPPTQGGEWTKGFSALGSRVSTVEIISVLETDVDVRLRTDYVKEVFLALAWTTSYPESRTSYQPEKSSPSLDSLRR